MKARPILVSALLTTWLAGMASAQSPDDSLRVLGPDAGGVPPGEQLTVWLKRGFYEMVEARSAAFEVAIKSEAACRKWQEDRRAFFLEQIGGLPKRTPLNPRIVGTLQGKGYRVENLLLETRPGFHLTANLYLPDTPPPYPAVLVPCGHSHDGKAVAQYQRASILLAQHGMAAICYDPIGQGERYQMLDLSTERTAFEDAAHVPVPHPNVRLLCTTEHTMMAIGSALIGANVAQYRIWDGMRVIDYLQTRDDILPDKIGCTGNSGGGTETAYLMALDDRIVAAAPGCYLTTFRALIDTKGPQDGEQNIFAQISYGMDEADYCIMRAPKPTLIVAGTRDATFDFNGTWDLYKDVKRFYSRLGRTDAVDINAPDAPHGFTLQQREAVASWMHRWLLGREKLIREVDPLPDAFTDEQLREWNQPDWTQEQLYCTPKGQVLLMEGERSVFDINAAAAADLKKTRASVWSGLSEEARRSLVEKVVGSNETLPDPETREAGEVPRDGYTIRKLVLPVDEGLSLPALAFVPEKPAVTATLYLHGTSMAADAAPGGPIEALVRQGHLVLAAELRGIGETETGIGKNEFGKGRFGPDNLDLWTAYLMGKSYVGMRTADARAWTRVLRRLAGEKAPLHLVASGEAAIPALHAAALDGAPFADVRLTGMLPDWESLVGAGETHNQFVNIVHGALRHYDLPDLVPLAGGPERVEISDPVGAMGRSAR
ncbi:MAG: hypothetical protein JNK37_03060 [Verrucomicrobiales bacterium]|nr:hypothetical protein [Verrucomicrobiales bacterium]